MKESLFIREEFEKLNNTIRILEEKIVVLEKENAVLKNRVFIKKQNLLTRLISFISGFSGNSQYKQENRKIEIQDEIRKTG